VTGISDNATTLSTKRLELLKQAVPSIHKVAMLWNKDDLGMTLRYRASASPRTSLIISDEGLSSETGRGTEFVILMSGEPQGGIKHRRQFPQFEIGYDRPSGWSPYSHSNFGRPLSTW
jgi:hypothetical protein